MFGGVGSAGGPRGFGARSRARRDGPTPAIHSPQVISVGPGVANRDGKLIPVNVKAGDRVLLPEYGGHTVKIADEEFTLYRDEDILGRFELK